MSRFPFKVIAAPVNAGRETTTATIKKSKSADGTEVVDVKVNEADLLTTLCQALGVSPHTENISEVGRPIRIAEGNIIKEAVA